MRVLCKDAPERTIVLVANGYALTMRHQQSTEEGSGNIEILNYPKCIVEFTSADAIPLAEYRTLGTGLGTLGLIALAAGEVFICIVTQATNVASVRPGETVQRIDSVDFCTKSPAQILPFSSLLYPVDWTRLTDIYYRLLKPI